MNKTLISPYLKLLRPEQWLKSIFVLLGIIYSHSWERLGYALLAFVDFSLAASAVYVLNDIHDRNADALHPDKCQRPIACGQVSVRHAYWLLLGLVIVSFLLSFYVSYQLSIIILCYWLINYAYNLGLKKWPIVDVICIASGFVLRMLAGTLGIGLAYSRWLLVSVTFLSLLIALSKRYLEKQRALKEFIRPALNYYSNVLLKGLIIINALFALISYLVYIIAVHHRNLFFLLTIIFALGGMARYLHVLFKSFKQQDDPILVMLGDSMILIYLFGFAICTMLAFLGT